MKNSIIIDGHSLACPNKNEFTDILDYSIAFRKYLQDLISWSDAGRYFRLVSNNDIESVLHKTGSFPFWDSIQEALSFLNLATEYQVQDIVKLIDSILSKAERIEDIIEIDDVICENSIFYPCGAFLGRGLYFIEHFQRLIGLLELDRKFLKKIEASSAVVTTCKSNQDGKVEMIGELIDYNMINSARPFEVPYDFSYSVMVAPSLLELTKNLSYLDIWKRRSKDSCSLAIEIYLIQQMNFDLLKISDLRENWNIGLGFLPSLLKLDLFHDSTKVEKIIRSVTEGILRAALSDVHALRSGPGANDPTVMRGKYKAQRRDIDDEFHLHYWDNGSTIEISNVVVHNNFEIFK